MRDKLAQQAPAAWQFCGRNVIVLDGTSVSMPDTAENQQRWPQPTGQKTGCGFPVVKMLGVFCLSTGAWLGHALAKCCAHDLSQWHRVSDIKTTMAMEVLRCKAPAMVEKEIYMHATAYNAIRLLILHSAIEHQCELGRISFKGALGIISQWLPKAGSYADKPRKLAQWKDELLEAIAAVKNPARPCRREPRAKKRRPKNYPLLTAPRHEYQEIPHRGNYRKAA